MDKLEEEFALAIYKRVEWISVNEAEAAAQACAVIARKQVSELEATLRETRSRWDDLSTTEHERPGLRNYARISADKISAALHRKGVEPK